MNCNSYIVNFGNARPIAPKNTDESIVCASWGLSKPSKGVEEEYKKNDIKIKET